MSKKSHLLGEGKWLLELYETISVPWFFAQIDCPPLSSIIWRGVHAWLVRIADRYQVDVERSGWELRLAQEMYTLNVAAVNQRYNEHRDTSKIVYSLYPYTSRVAAWKALGCWLYQCSEGNVPRTKLYQYFKELEK